MTRGAYSSIVDISEKNSYLIPNDELRGLGPPYVKSGGFFEASKPMDPAILAGSGIQMASIPSPITNKWIYLPDGNVSAPGLAFATETNSGRYKIGSNNIGESINSTLIYDWTATSFTVHVGTSTFLTGMTSGSVLFTGASGLISQDNSNFFWDDTNNYLGIGTNTPIRALEVRHASLPQLALSVDANKYVLMTASGIGLLCEHVTNLGFAPTYEFRGDNNNDHPILKIYNTHTTGSSSHAWMIIETGGASAGDPILLWDVDFAQIWAAGIDNSDSDKWKLSKGAALGTNDYLVVDTSGNLGVNTSPSHRFHISEAVGGVTYQLYFENNVTGALLAGLNLQRSTTGTAIGVGFWGTSSTEHWFMGMDYLTTDFSFYDVTAAHDVIRSVAGSGCFTFSYGGLAAASTDRIAIHSDANDQAAIRRLLHLVVTAGGSPVTTPFLMECGGISPFITLANTDAPQSWTFGVDRADSSKFKLSASATLGTTDAIVWTTGGSTLHADGAVGAPAISFKSGTTTGFYWSAVLRLAVGGTLTYSFGSTQFFLHSDSAEIDMGASSDAKIYRDAAAAIAIRNSTTAQAFRVYNTFTSGTSFERGNFTWASNVLNIGTEKGSGGGTARALTLQTDGTDWFGLSTTGSISLCKAGNGQNVTIENVTELTTIAAAATTDTAIQIPADAVVFAVSVRVTVAIPTAVTFTVTGTTSATQFDVAGGVSVAANTTDVGTRNCPYKNGAAQTIRITPSAVPAANTGRVRVTIHYYKITVPTS